MSTETKLGNELKLIALLAAARGSTAREPEMMWVCGTWGVGVDFLTHSTEIAMAWKNENQWHSAHQKPVRSNVRMSDGL